jgi:hypothetical protein
MNQEHEQSHAGSSAAAATHNDTSEPGQSARSALLRKPDHAVASGLVQRKAHDADGAAHAVAASSSSGSPRLDANVRADPAVEVETRAFSPPKEGVTTTTVWLRGAPMTGPTSSKIRTFKAQTFMTVKAEVKSKDRAYPRWLAVEVDKKSGYMAADFVTLSEKPKELAGVSGLSRHALHPVSGSSSGHDRDGTRSGAGDHNTHSVPGIPEKRAQTGGMTASTESGGAPRDPFPSDKHTPARSFAALVELIALAEDRLNGAGYDTAKVVHILRGIFYGTEWSVDNKGESKMRNLAFRLYTAQLAPDDPRPLIGSSLFLALRASAEVKDPKGHYVDFGHLIIGLDSRNWASRRINIPTQGGTGHAITTWLGDLGGGAGMLAINRGLDGRVTKRALSHFKGGSYGTAINLEGDIAGVVGVELTPGQKLADALKAYLIPPKEDTQSRWNRRAQLMLESLGGTVKNGVLDNEIELIAKTGRQIEDFACWYAATRLKGNGQKLTANVCRNVGYHIAGAANEMATIFIVTLVWALADPKRDIDAQRTGYDPDPTPAATTAPYQLETLAKLVGN